LRLLLQGLPIAIVEEIAFENGWITRDQLMESAERYGKSLYSQHLKGIADGEIMLVPNQKSLFSGDIHLKGAS
jgi:glucose-1-phosphate thymidylyltransferase